MQCSKVLLGALTGLSRLMSLWIGPVDGVSDRDRPSQCVERLCQLPWLRNLGLKAHSEPHVMLLLTQLKQLTCLSVHDEERGW